jgi:chemotaxis protein methyltransferase CheR
VTARLGKRLRQLGLVSYDDYCRLLRQERDGEELTQLIDAISTNHTFFFREGKHFEWLRDDALPEFARRHGSLRKFRCWSAASSTGEEPYSIAITLSEFFAAQSRCLGWSMDASDISTRVLAKAREGVYPAERVRDLSAEALRRHFLHGTGDYQGFYQVRPEIRSQVNFHHINLFQTSYPFRERFDVIFCRNVMIYFDRGTQEQLVRRLHEHLEPGGLLFVGHSESLTGIMHAFSAVKPAIYRKAGQ